MRLLQPHSHPNELSRSELRTDTPAEETIMWLMILIGIIGGGLLASIVAFGLASIILFSPLAGLCRLGGEFDGLWIVGLPICSLPCGAIGGAVLGVQG